METLTTSQRDYQRLINWCIAVTAACAAGASYLPAYSWPFIALAAISGAVALVAFLRKEATESSRQVKLARNSFDGASSNQPQFGANRLGCGKWNSRTRAMTLRSSKFHTSGEALTLEVLYMLSTRQRACMRLRLRCSVIIPREVGLH